MPNLLSYICQVQSTDGVHKVGQITKQWTGFAKEVFTDADNFGISFPLDLDVKIKSVLLGAVFLIVSELLIISHYNSPPPTHNIFLVHIYDKLKNININVPDFSGLYVL